MGALTIWKGKSSEAALSKAQADRTALMARIAKRDADRASHLIETDDIAAIDCGRHGDCGRPQGGADPRPADCRYRARLAAAGRDAREVVRTAAIKTIARLYAARTAQGQGA